MYINKFLKVCATLLGCIYIGSMVIQPLCIGGFDNLMKTWREWQTFNAGMIAIFAAIISAYIALHLDKSARQREAVKISESRQNERQKLRAEKQARDEQREREFIAARPFLPASLTLIHEYVELISKDLLRLYAVIKADDENDLRRYVADIKFKNMPSGYQGVFKECITLSTPDVSKHLAYILVHLQVFSSRVESLDPQHLDKRNLGEMLVDSIRFLFKIDSMFDFAREGLPIKDIHRTVDNYYSRINRLLDYQIRIERGENKQIDKFIDSAARRD
ncbi:MAG: hypothetical protein HRT97_19485 [Moritella sp.]|uniref:hypothetical protein n=1 Tax=Moritella sp. TaxID=78556 RepID=UPI0025F949D7|nr:hypothetical protein [Moritella sp.]NQZ94498.1 hypothetical protein [Moritella sp.]